MSELTLTKPVKFKGGKLWIVYIGDRDGLCTRSGMGDSPKKATEAAQAKIDAETK